MIEDADGSLLVADTGSWYMICCPTSKVAKPHVLGAIYRIKKKGSPKLNDSRGIKLDWQNPEIKWLNDERPHVVQRSMKVLAREENIEPLKASDAHLPALWTLHRVPGNEARKAVRDF